MMLAFNVKWRQSIYMLILLVLPRTFINLAQLKYQCNEPLKWILLESYSLKKCFIAKHLLMKKVSPSYLIDKQVQISYVINFPIKIINFD